MGCPPNEIACAPFDGGEHVGDAGYRGRVVDATDDREHLAREFDVVTDVGAELGTHCDFLRRFRRVPSSISGMPGPSVRAPKRFTSSMSSPVP